MAKGKKTITGAEIGDILIAKKNGFGLFHS
jgi:hypothetical protein